MQNYEEPLSLILEVVKNVQFSVDRSIDRSSIGWWEGIWVPLESGWEGKDTGVDFDTAISLCLSHLFRWLYIPQSSNQHLCQLLSTISSIQHLESALTRAQVLGKISWLHLSPYANASVKSNTIFTNKKLCYNHKGGEDRLEQIQFPPPPSLFLIASAASQIYRAYR